MQTQLLSMIEGILRNIADWEEDFFSFLDDDSEEDLTSHGGERNSTGLEDGVFSFEDPGQTAKWNWPPSDNKSKTTTTPGTTTTMTATKKSETVHKNFDTGQVLNAILTMTKVS